MRVHQGRPDKRGAKDALDFSVPTSKWEGQFMAFSAREMRTPEESPSQIPLGIWTGARVHCSCWG